VFNSPSVPAQPREFGTSSIETAFNFTTPNDDGDSKHTVCRMRRLTFSG
jgi:hypothetical protein